MKQNNHIDLVEFPASSPEELESVAQFFNRVFGWQFKNWDKTYHDTHDSGVTTGINASTTKEQTMPLVVIYVEDLEAIGTKIIKSGGKLTHPITSFPGGRRFAFTDTAGNQLAAWSDK
jgi:predicted enzyme related to lactoylglutathione lyase